MTRVRFGSATDVGRRRSINQDMILVSGTIFAIADGMGGHQGGEVASLAAVEALKEVFQGSQTLEGLQNAIRAANDAVGARSQASNELRNMGTTLTVVALVDDQDDDLLVIANIGDSRAYLLRSGELSQLTEDHSVPQELLRQGQLSEAEAAVDPRRNILTRVLGPSYGDGPDIQNLIPYTGDRIMLCSDGLYNEVDDDAIARVLRTVADPEEAARQLVDQANANGGADNISVIVVDIVDDDGRAVTASEVLADEAPSEAKTGSRQSGRLMTADERNAELRQLGRPDFSPRAAPASNSWETNAEPDVHAEPERRVTLRVVGFVVAMLLVLGGAAVAIGFYARGSYYVGLDDDQVAIFKGRPGGILWFSPTVEEVTPITEAAVPPARVEAVRQGHPVATLEEARSYVRSLESTPGAGATTDTTTTTTPPEPAPEPTPSTSTP